MKIAMTAATASMTGTLLLELGLFGRAPSKIRYLLERIRIMEKSRVFCSCVDRSVINMRSRLGTKSPDSGGENAAATTSSDLF